MGVFILKNDISAGYIQNTGELNILFKKGDKVQGEIEEVFIFNRLMKGVNVKPTVKGAHNESPDGLAFIAIDNLQEVKENVKVANMAETKITLKQTLVISLAMTALGVGLTFGVLKVMKII